MQYHFCGEIFEHLTRFLICRDIFSISIPPMLIIFSVAFMNSRCSHLSMTLNSLYLIKSKIISKITNWFDDETMDFYLAAIVGEERIRVPDGLLPSEMVEIICRNELLLTASKPFRDNSGPNPGFRGSGPFAF